MKFPDNTYDILIKTEGIDGLSEDDQYLAARLAIDGVMGEEKRMELIVEISIVKNFPTEQEKSVSDFRNLLNHLKQHFKSDLL